ncbi:MAG: stage III sporulation protein AF [Peptococcaceae bacterium]|nr:stage III sporulation protein AF [Peptococcaceae bacterium]
MEGLKTLIRNLAFILLLATFLELLLPGEKMRGFVRMIMGLFVIAAILAPLANFLNLGYQNEVPAWITTASSDMPVMTGEDNIEDVGKSAVREQYRKILTSQIKQLVLAVDDIKDVAVDIELDRYAGGFSDFPQILSINIVYNRKTAVIPSLDPIIVGGNKVNEPAAENDKAQTIRKQVSSFMQIPEDIIFVREQ